MTEPPPTGPTGAMLMMATLDISGALSPILPRDDQLDDMPEPELRERLRDALLIVDAQNVMIRHSIKRICQVETQRHQIINDMVAMRMDCIDKRNQDAAVFEAMQPLATAIFSLLRAPPTRAQTDDLFTKMVTFEEALDNLRKRRQSDDIDETDSDGEVS